ncbi:precorrin-6y C5,15-methyltransferase (decarboxylating) subunit CbiE [Gordonia sp. (in: high G+C Gram-positive bacteria)]|uniref:precorrin-6y C5,15-methyltransferase (decarboxylating) subunit CbiE n=1 Tax=Gordonia sp. (in: high G+C Gram-positive bacteria) TaxID=84139 RepID=UPI003F964DA3
MTADVVVVGIGAGGWRSLSPAAQSELSEAVVIYGSARQLDLVPDDVGATRVRWRSPMSEHLAELGESDLDSTVHVLASGDPMFHGIGASLVRVFGAARVRVIAHPSSATLAAARLGWDLARTRIVSLVTAPVDALAAHLTDGAALLILSRDATTPADVADLLANNGFGASPFTVLSDLGADSERVQAGRADTWTGAPSALNIIAVDCVGPVRSRAPGLADEDFTHRGQITKRPMRALTVSALRPAEEQVLWDVGAGAGSVGIEWLRLTASGRVVAFESDAERSADVLENARTHGVVDRLDLRGAAPDALSDAPAPDAVFIGGGMTPEVLEIAWNALASGGRMVANAVTLETERLVVDAADRWGGELLRVSVERASPLGGSTAWRPALPVVQWTAVKTETEGTA